MSPVSKNCGKCKTVIKGRAFLYCSDCNLHFHIECKNYEKLYYLMDAEKKAKWKCDICRRRNHLAKNKDMTTSSVSKTPLARTPTLETATPRQGPAGSCATALPAPADLLTSDDDEVNDPYQNVTLRKSRKPSTCSNDASSQQCESHHEITVALKEYIKQEMSALTQQLLTKMDSLAASIHNFDTRCHKIEERVTVVENRLDERDEKVNDLTRKVDQLTNILNDKEQELLVNEIEISGIPELNGENPVHLMNLVGNKLGVNISANDVVSAVRVGTPRRRDPAPTPVTREPARHNAAAAGAPAGTAKVGGAADDESGPRLLVVRLLRRAQKDELLRAARVRRGADTTGLGLPGPARRFYVNERLTRANRLLFRRAREEARRLGWKFVWTRDGAILARRENGEPTRRIRSEEDLVKVFGVQPVSD